ncbi:MAG: sulfurtransferase, partial [Acidimicrobiales bacterium]
MQRLVDTTWLNEHLDDDIVILEVSADSPDAAAYFTTHVPGARYANWKDLCWHETDREFPTAEVMTSRLRSLGVRDSSTIVLVGDPIQYGTYTYWVLTMTGFGDKLALLDGGRSAWMSSGFATTAEVIEPEPGGVQPGPAVETCRVGRDDVRSHLGSTDRALLDMRS